MLTNCLTQLKTPMVACWMSAPESWPGWPLVGWQFSVLNQLMLSRFVCKPRPSQEVSAEAQIRLFTKALGKRTERFSWKKASLDYGEVNNNIEFNCVFNSWINTRTFFFGEGNSLYVNKNKNINFPTGTLPNVGRNAIVNVSEIVCYDLVKESILRNGLLNDNIMCHFSAAVVAGKLAVALFLIVFPVYSNESDSDTWNAWNMRHSVVSTVKNVILRRTVTNWPSKVRGTSYNWSD